MSYAVVETKSQEGELEVSVIPTKWIHGCFCWWPPKGTIDKAKQIRLQYSPTAKWTRHEMKILKNKIGN